MRSCKVVVLTMMRESGKSFLYVAAYFSTCCGDALVHEKRRMIEGDFELEESEEDEEDNDGSQRVGEELYRESRFHFPLEMESKSTKKFEGS